ncbi:MAG: hypothetical protein ACO3JL_03055 [Myxococcota bacterium]
MSLPEFDVEKVYLVESEEDDSVLLAIEPSFRDGHMCWFDTLRPRALPGRLESLTGEGARFVSSAGATYRFRPLTLAVYEARVRPRVEAAPSFASDAELHRFYRERF